MMTTGNVFDKLHLHYKAISEELASAARQASILNHPSVIGTEREEIYRGFLERHVPKTCDVFLGGYVFNLEGNRSKAIDVIVAGGNAPRFRLSAGNHYIAPLEGMIAVAEIKTMLDKRTLSDALCNFASIPPSTDQEGVAAPFLRAMKEELEDWPFKVVFAYQGIEAKTLGSHMSQFYSDNPSIPINRRPHLIHVLDSYLFVRITSETTLESDFPTDHEHDVGKYHHFDIEPDPIGLAFTLHAIQKRTFLSNFMAFQYGDLHNGMVDRIRRG